VEQHHLTTYESDLKKNDEKGDVYQVKSIIQYNILEEVKNCHFRFNFC
jgi:hypothetical protein